MRQWAYKAILYEFGVDSNLQSVLDGHGGNGWELVSSNANRTTELLLIFKRPVE